MKVIFNDIIPIKGYIAMCLWPLIFVLSKAKARYTDVTDNHERIHAEQQKEMLAVGLALAAVLALLGCGWWSLLALPLFLWWYGIEWLVGIIRYRDKGVAYCAIRFEREAYDHERDLQYLKTRKRFAWLR